LSEKLLRHDLIVIDELGYLPFSQSGGQLLWRSMTYLSATRASLRLLSWDLLAAGPPVLDWESSATTLIGEIRSCSACWRKTVWRI
jgi:hypothetical protein